MRTNLAEVSRDFLAPGPALYGKYDSVARHFPTKATSEGDCTT